jgi:predicted nucleic acid-binding protein
VKLLDTSIAVDHLRNYPPATALLEEWIRSDEPISVSELTRFELIAGVRAGERHLLEASFRLSTGFR